MIGQNLELPNCIFRRSDSFKFTYYAESYKGGTRRQARKKEPTPKTRGQQFLRDVAGQRGDNPGGFDRGPRTRRGFPTVKFFISKTMLLGISIGKNACVKCLV
jgi:hypothetical protein